MADLLADGLAWLSSQLKTYASQKVLYSRGGQNVDILATVATQILRTSDHLGNSKVERPDADFVFAAADLDFGDGNGVIEPAAGDLVEVVLGGVTKQFRAMPHGSDPAWRYSDPHQNMVRVHTKLVGTVA